MSKNKSEFILLRYAFILILISAIVLLVLLVFFLKTENAKLFLSMLAVAVIPFIGAISIVVYYYLQKGTVSDSSFGDQDMNSQLEALWDRVGHLSHEAQRIEERYADDLKGKIDSLTTDAVLTAIDEKFHKQQIDKFNLDFIRRQIESAKANIEDRIASKTRSGNINLTLGFSTTVIALFYLVWSLLGSDLTTKEITEYAMSHNGSRVPISLFLIKFLPRLSVSIFIELFSFFFLSMYRKGNEEIQYLTNEKTNIEMKVLALQTAIMSGRNEALDKVISELSKTERNFVLKKGESTVEIEKNKLEKNVVKETLRGVGYILNRGKN